MPYAKKIITSLLAKNMLQVKMLVKQAYDGNRYFELKLSRSYNLIARSLTCKIVMQNRGNVLNKLFVYIRVQRQDRFCALSVVGTKLFFLSTIIQMERKKLSHNSSLFWQRRRRGPPKAASSLGKGQKIRLKKKMFNYSNPNLENRTGQC